MGGGRITCVVVEGERESAGEKREGGKVMCTRMLES